VHTSGWTGGRLPYTLRPYKQAVKSIGKSPGLFHFGVGGRAECDLDPPKSGPADKGVRINSGHVMDEERFEHKLVMGV
jgi:hypothetical protein